MVGPGSVEAPSLAVAPGSPYAGLVISQIYGGGGNGGSTYRNDFIELYNSSGNPIPLNGLSVQYTSSGGTSWATTALTNVTLAPGQYYLVQEAAGTGGTAPLPTPDAVGAGNGIAMSATTGKVALVVGTGPLAGTGCPIGTNIIDFIGYGGANCFEGAAAAGVLTNTTAAIRADSGRTDTNQNGADFITNRGPNPRNTAAPLVPPKSFLSVTISPTNSQVQLGRGVTFTATASKNNAPVAITSATWTSSNTGVATIDPTSGAVTTVGLGATTIRVDAVTAEGSASNSTTLTVAAEPARVSVSPSTWVLVPTNPTRTFSATAFDAGGTPTSTVFTWSSSDPSIMTVVETTGAVTGKTYGTALIIATSANGIADTAVVHVSNMRVQGRVDGQGQPLPLPVGFQTQLFLSGTNTDRNGNPVGNSDVTWSSRNPDVVSVNPSTGVITAKSAGTAIITATAKSDGVSAASTEIVTNVATLAPNARTGHNTELGIPVDGDASDDVIIERRQYTLSYNPARRAPNWVSWNLDPSHEGSVTRCNCFTADTALTRLGYPALDTQDWVNGGVWSRGHLSPSADWQVTDGDNAPTFFLTNMLPQNQTMNAGAWGDLENRLRVISDGSKEIYIIAGGIFTKGRTGGLDGFGFTTGTGHIAVPDSMWKVAVVVPDGRGASQIGASDVQVIAVKMPNEASATGTYDRYVTTIDEIQKSSGYDLLAALPENVQCAVEARNCAPVAAITGSGLAGGDEGETLTFSGTTSSDPNGDALSYDWQVAGTTVGSSAALSYTFANDGAYELRLTVTDSHGASSTTTATVSVRNVAPAVNAFAGAAIDEGGSYVMNGSFTDPGDDHWTATVDYGDGSGVQPLALGAGKSFSLAHRYADNGSYTVTVTVVESSASAASGAGSATVTVANVAPVVSGFSGATILAGERFTSSGTFADPGADSWTGTVNYGDGSGATPLTLTGDGFELDHEYASAGSYTVTVQVSDEDGGVGTRTVTVLVQTAAQGVSNLSGMLGGLGLSNGEASSLRAKLNAASAALRRDDSTPAANQLEAFINETDAMVRSGRLAESAAAAIAAYARRVIASIEG